MAASREGNAVVSHVVGVAAAVDFDSAAAAGGSIAESADAGEAGVGAGRVAEEAAGGGCKDVGADTAAGVDKH